MSKLSYEELFEAYVDQFGDAFPTFMAPPGDEEQMAIMERCLKSGTPYDPTSDPDYDPEADY